MNHNHLIFTAVAALAASSAASAVFTGLTIDTSASTLTPPGVGFWVVRVRATFDDPGDRMLMVANADIQSTQELYQHFLGDEVEPDGVLLAFYPDMAYDSYVTINHFSTLEPGPTTHLQPGSAFSATGFTGGWYTDGDAPFASGQLSYVIAQLTIQHPLGMADIWGSLTVGWKQAGVPGIVFSDASFTTVPGPGGVMVLGLGLRLRRRRRR